MPEANPALVASLELHAQAAHAESPHRYGASLSTVLSLGVLQQGALLVESALADYAGPAAEQFIAGSHDEIAAWVSPKLADLVKGLVAQFGTQAKQSGGL